MTFQKECFFFKVCTINTLLLSQKINQFHFNYHPGGGGGLPYETDGNARHLA